MVVSRVHDPGLTRREQHPLTVGQRERGAGLRFGRDQCTVNARPLRRTTAVPEPVEMAYGGRPPYSWNREVAILVS